MSPDDVVVNRIRQAGIEQQPTPPPASLKTKPGEFERVLSQELRKGGIGTGPQAIQDLCADRLRFSGHAQTRLASRNISLAPEQVARLVEAVDLAEAKGARESLVLLEDLAFVVSVRNRTVITAVEREAASGNVFTSIDSAVII